MPTIPDKKASRGQKENTPASKPTPKQERLAAINRKINLLSMLAAFANTLLISLFIGAGFIAQQISVVDNPADVSNSFGLIAYMIFAAAVMLAILRYYKGRLFFQLMEYGLIATSVEVFGAVFLPEYELYLVVAAVAARFLFPSLATFFLLAASIIVGSIIGASLDFIPIAVFAVLLAAYDYIAVFHTKHMITLAKGLSERQAAFSIKIGTSTAPKNDSTARTLPTGSNSIELGLGDFLIGVMLSVAALKIGVFPAFDYALASVLGATAGLAIMFIILERKGGFFPAVPPIAAGSLLSIAVYWCVRALFGTV